MRQVDKHRAELARLEIIKSIPLERILSEEGAKIRGNKGMCKCPLHDEGIPSFSYDLDRGVFNCFSCGTHGTVIQLIQACESTLHGRNLTNQNSTIEYILKTYPMISKSLGFSTIFVDVIEEKKLKLKTDGTIDFGFEKRYRPMYRQRVSYHKLIASLKKELIASRAYGDEASISSCLAKLADFISGCEYEMSPELLEDILNGLPFDNLDPGFVSADEDIIDGFDSLL